MCGNTLHRQTVGIPMGTNCAPLVADLFLYLATLVAGYYVIACAAGGRADVIISNLHDNSNSPGRISKKN